MKQKANVSFKVWFVFFNVLALFLILQNSFLSFFLKPAFVPYMLWPPLLFFFFYRSFLSSFFLLFFISLLSSVVLSLSVPILFFIYLFIYIIAIIIKQFVYSKSLFFFTSMVFVFSFLSSYFIEGAYGLSQLDFSVPNILFYWSKSFMTCILGIGLFPTLKFYFPVSEGF